MNEGNNQHEMSSISTVACSLIHGRRKSHQKKKIDNRQERAAKYCTLFLRQSPQNSTILAWLWRNKRLRNKRHVEGIFKQEAWQLWKNSSEAIAWSFFGEGGGGEGEREIFTRSFLSAPSISVAKSSIMPRSICNSQHFLDYHYQ